MKYTKYIELAQCWCEIFQPATFTLENSLLLRAEAFKEI